MSETIWDVIIKNGYSLYKSEKFIVLFCEDYIFIFTGEKLDDVLIIGRDSSYYYTNHTTINDYFYIDDDCSKTLNLPGTYIRLDKLLDRIKELDTNIKVRTEWSSGGKKGFAFCFSNKQIPARILETLKKYDVVIISNDTIFVSFHFGMLLWDCIINHVYEIYDEVVSLSF